MSDTVSDTPVSVTVALPIGERHDTHDTRTHKTPLEQKNYKNEFSDRGDLMIAEITTNYLPQPLSFNMIMFD